MTVGYRERVPDTAGGVSPAAPRGTASWARLPRAVGGAVVAIEPLRHGLPEIAESATDGYLRGLRDGGWTGSSDAVRTTIAACGAAKYSWFAPMIVGRAARDHIGPSSHGQDTSAGAAIQRVTRLVVLIADWAEAAHG